MDIKKTKNDEELVIALTGRLDTSSSPQLEAELKDQLNDVTSLVFDLSDLEYISSAGLRVLLAAQKMMDTKGTLTVKNADESVREVFSLTGFDDILNIE